jgi:thiamine kinase-like enzyme
MTAVIEQRDRRGRTPEERHEPGAAEVQELLQRIPGGAPVSGDAVSLERLHKGVYRLRIDDGMVRTFVVKRHTPTIAQRDRLVVDRWLPAAGLGDRCPRLVAAVAQREGRWVWHAYEDLVGDTLAQRRDQASLDVAIDLVAELHTRGAGHPLLPEVRWHARDHGARSLTSSVRDGIAALEALAAPSDAASPALATVRSRLLERLYGLLEAAPGRVRIMEEVGGPDTLLHGDLLPKNVFVTPTDNGPRARLIDWDHVGVGPASYDLSTLLYQSSAEARPRVLRRYREAVERAGHRLPADGELNQLFYAAETARGASCVIWPAMALLNDGAQWGAAELVEIDRWFASLRPPLGTA